MTWRIDQGIDKGASAISLMSERLLSHITRPLLNRSKSLLVSTRCKHGYQETCPTK